MATSYGIIKQSNGFITVLSEISRGTEMCLFFQANQSELAPLQPESSDDELPSGRETLLVVEDEPAVRYLEVCVLRECGYNVLEAANGAERQEIVVSQQPAPGTVAHQGTLITIVIDTPATLSAII